MTSTAQSLAVAIFVLGSPLAAIAQEGKKSADRSQVAEGVIVKVEKVADEKDDKDKNKDKDKAPRRVKITVNTAAVWSDYVRDEARVKGSEAGKDGENSIATKGQPVSPNNVVVAEIGPATKLSTRFRSSTDETNKGSRTVQGAEKKDGSPASDDVKRRLRDEKAPKIGVGDLKVGQFVEIEAKAGKANRLIVLKPVGGPNTPESEAKPAK